MVSPTLSSAPPAEEVWARLARLIAAPGRAHMRLWNPDTGKFTDSVRRTKTLPTRPAALYIFAKGRTLFLPFDFDAKVHGAAAVRRDVATLVTWLTQCGGVVVTDRSTSQGAHVLCPLAIGTSASVAEVKDLLRLLAARLPTLDITPGTNADTGCITPPGSPCREGGYRVLAGSLDDAIEAFTTRSAGDLLSRLYMLLGAIKPSPSVAAATARTATVEAPAFTTGSGDELRLLPAYTRPDPFPAAVITYAETGVLDHSDPHRATWRTRSEARMAVVTHALDRGYSLNDIRRLIAQDGAWQHGLGAAYVEAPDGSRNRQQYRNPDRALQRDVNKAFEWLLSGPVKYRHQQHKKGTQGGGSLSRGPGRGFRGPLELRIWLANAWSWADFEYAGKRQRWTVYAVLQSLAIHAWRNGEYCSGTWVVGVGGRSLSLGAGLLSPDVVWRVLKEIRDVPGAPVLLTRSHVGQDADFYALTSQNMHAGARRRADLVRIEVLHPAWHVLGHHLRRVYELVFDHGLSARADIFAAAAVPRSTGDDIIRQLQEAGLLAKMGRTCVGPGKVSLDEIASAHDLDELRDARATRYREQRAAWHDWLEARRRQREGITDCTTTPVIAVDPEWELEAELIDEAWKASVMATGPPDEGPEGERHRELNAITLVGDILGGKIVPTAA